MAERILLVSGSRALSDTPAAEAWARERLRAAIDWHEPTLLVHGGCLRSPDVWAHEIAECPVLVYRADGRLVAYGGPEGDGAHTSWLEPGDVAHPLLRNERMVAAVSLRRYEGDDVLVVGLVALWTRTRGTDHTLRLAANHSLRMLRRECPAELGPRALRDRTAGDG